MASPLFDVPSMVYALFEGTHKTGIPTGMPNRWRRLLCVGSKFRYAVRTGDMEVIFPTTARSRQAKDLGSIVDSRVRSSGAEK